MKELSIEEKARRYDGAIKRLEDIETGKCKKTFMFTEGLFNYIFPELKESEDEKIREELIETIHLAYDCGCSLNKEQRDKYLAWIEKQGEQNPATDKIELKFKVGDWVVNRFGDVWHIDSFDNKNYQVSNGDKYCYFPIEKQDEMHLWTIQDAKDGDVLCDYHEAYDNPLIFILKKFEHVNFGLVRPSDYSSYCFLTSSDRQRFKKGTYHHEHNIKPTTKEQRDLLFQKMKEAGYEWDAERKELKKIEEEYNGKDYGIDGLWHAQSILEKTLGKVDGYQSDDGILEHKCAISAVKQLYEQKPAAWSEEDENRINRLILYFEDKESFTAEDDVVYANWLKSLKERYTWKPSDEQMEALDDFIYAKYPNIEKYGAVVKSLYQDLKKLTEE